MRATKHIALIVVLWATFALLLAGALTAYATYGDSTYLDWDAVSAKTGNTGSTSPHGKYTTSTTKCGVCHSVHGAAAGGEALLQTTKANACTYCHVSPGVSVMIVYGGVASNYSGGDINTAHNTTSNMAGQDGVQCSGCHQVHGATEYMTANSSLSDKILSGPKDSYDSDEPPNPLYDPRAGAPLVGDPYDDAMSKWCTKCHFSDKYGYYSNFYDDETHVMAAPSGGYLNGAGTDLGDVAYQSSSNCSNCHSSGYGTGSWPHFTPGAARFLESADDSATAPVGATSSKSDGVCLKCHRDGLGSGVGLHY